MKVFSETHLFRLEDMVRATDAPWLAERELLGIARENLAAAKRQLSDVETDNSQVASEQKKVDRHLSTMDRLNETRIAASSILRTVREHIRANGMKPSVSGSEQHFPAPTVPPGQAQKAVDKLRAEIEHLKAERLRVAGMHVSRDVAETRLRAEYDALRSQFGSQAPSGLFEPHGSGAGLLLRPSSGTGILVRGVAYSDAVMSPGVVVALLGEAALAHFTRQIDEYYNASGPGISDADRKLRLGQIAAQQRQLEEREEALIRFAEEQGIIIRRRLDADPEAIIGPVWEQPEQKAEPYVSKNSAFRSPVNQRAAEPVYHKGPLTSGVLDV